MLLIQSYCCAFCLIIDRFIPVFPGIQPLLSCVHSIKQRKRIVTYLFSHPGKHKTLGVFVNNENMHSVIHILYFLYRQDDHWYAHEQI